MVSDSQRSQASQKNAHNQHHTNTEIDRERQLLLDAKQKGSWATFKSYIKLSGPGWLQSGITLGGGSLSSSLYL